MGVHVVRGDDPILRGDVLEGLVRALVGEDERSLVVEDLTVPSRAGTGDSEGDSPEGRTATVAAAVNAAGSPPFMTTCRVVVLRDVGNLSASDVGPLVACVGDLLETTELVFVVGGGKVPDALTKAWKQAGATDHAAAQGKASDVLADAAGSAGITFRPDAVRAIADRVGNEVGRIPAIVDVLLTAHGPGARLAAADVEPYLAGDDGGVPPWELTKAIENGDVPSALAVLHRLLTATGPKQPKPMHPLQVLAMLHNHYRRVARLDDPGVGSKADAVAALGNRVRDFQAEKAWQLARSLGTDGVREAYAVLAQADLDLKGASAVPEDAVMEVLVARLAALSARSGVRSERRAPARSRGPRS